MFMPGPKSFGAADGPGYGAKEGATKGAPSAAAPNSDPSPRVAVLNTSGAVRGPNCIPAGGIPHSAPRPAQFCGLSLREDIADPSPSVPCCQGLPCLSPRPSTQAPSLALPAAASAPQESLNSSAIGSSTTGSSAIGSSTVGSSPIASSAIGSSAFASLPLDDPA